MKKYTATSYCIFTGSNYLACKDTDRFDQVAILEIQEDFKTQNSQHLIKNYPDLRIVPPSEYKKNGEYDLSSLGNKPDYLYANPPCSGLSSINRNAGGSNKTNNFMLEFFDIIEKVQPKVFFMENAPHLTGPRGWCLLKEMVELLGTSYNFNVCRDYGKYHGVPMTRERSLILGFSKEHFGQNANFTLSDPEFAAPSIPFLQRIGSPLPMNDAMISECSLNDHVSNLVTEYYDDILRIHRSVKKTFSAFSLIAMSDLNCTTRPEIEKLDWTAMIEKSSLPAKVKATFIREKNRIAVKLNTGGNCWDKSPVLVDNNTMMAPSLTAVTSIYNLEAKRGFTAREYARLMGYPDSFKFTDDVTVGHLAQGVPYYFAKFVHQNVANILDGKGNSIEGNIVLQKNHSGTYNIRVIDKPTFINMTTINH